MRSGTANNDKQQDTRWVVTRDDPKSPGAEAFRTLRTNLQFAGLDNPIRSLLVTSAGPGEGKSTVASNLGVAVAQSGGKVIVIGADLRRPQLQNALLVSNTVGMTTVLTGNMTWQEALQPTEVEGLSVLPSGPIPPNPAELLGSQRMKKLLEEMEQAVDLVIIDAPPIIAVTDAGILSRWSDGVLLVVSAGITPREIAKSAKEQLEQVGARILGDVVNRLSDDSSYYYYYYQDYYSNANQFDGQGQQLHWL